MQRKGDRKLYCLFINTTVNEILADFREKERLESDLYEKVRHAAEVHRQVRAYAQSFIKPGIKLIDMCEKLEETNRRLMKENGLQVSFTV